MRLSAQDKIELLKAAVKAPDRDSLADYVVSLVEVIDSLPGGKADAPAPRYQPSPAPEPATPLVELWAQMHEEEERRLQEGRVP
jgi:hypothetical protein